MNKQSFINQLKSELLPLKQSAKLEIMADMEEHFANGQALGKTEEQVAEELGSPKELAAEYIQQAEENEKTSLPPGSVGRSIIMAVGLFLLDVMIMIPIIASLFAVVIALWTIPLSLAVSAVFLLFLPLLSFVYTIPFWLCVIISISFIGLATATTIGMIYVSKYFFKMVASYAKAHYRIIKGGLKNE
jgi:uncharacterized membrane protein